MPRGACDMAHRRALAVSLALAGMGCVLQYLAYRLRTCYALTIAQQKQEQQMAAMSGAVTAETPDASVKKSAAARRHNTESLKESSFELPTAWDLRFTAVAVDGPCPGFYGARASVEDPDVTCYSGGRVC